MRDEDESKIPAISSISAQRNAGEGSDIVQRSPTSTTSSSCSNVIVDPQVTLERSIRENRSSIENTCQTRKFEFSQVAAHVASIAAKRNTNGNGNFLKKTKPASTNTSDRKTSSFPRSKRSVTGRFDTVGGILPFLPSAIAMKNMSIASQVATAAVARSHLLPAGHKREREVSGLMTSLINNDPDLISLKLYKRPAKYYDKFLSFLRAIKESKVITSVELSWIFLAALTESQRILLMKQLGLLLVITKIELEGIGPSIALSAALQGCHTKLQSLRIGSLRIANNKDVKELAAELQQNQSLQRVFLSNIRVKVEGQHRIGEEGMVRFEEINNQGSASSLIKLDPILNALAIIPTLTKIDLQLQLDGSKIARIDEETIQTLCNSTQYLILHSCNLDDLHCSAIAQVLDGNNSIELISMAENEKISEEGWTTIADMLEKNYSLHHFHTTTNYTFCPRLYPDYMSESSVPSDPCRAKMDFYLKLNRAGRGKLMMDGESDFHMGWIELIIQEKDDLDVVFYALVMNPYLCLV